MTETTEPFAGWAVVEIMGHQSFAGFVTEEVIAGAAMLRVDVPELPEATKQRQRQNWETRQEETWEETIPAIPGFTKYFAAGSLYAITPCTEDMARAYCERKRQSPISALMMPGSERPEPRLISSKAFEDEEDGKYPM